jgi:hypothetical protein
LDFRVVGVGRRTGCFVHQGSVGRGRAGSARCPPRRPAGWKWRTLRRWVKSFTSPGTLLVLNSLHARFPSLRPMTPPPSHSTNPPCQRASRAAKRYLRSVLRPTIDLGRKRLGWLKSATALAANKTALGSNQGFGSKSDWRGRQTKLLVAGKSHPAGRTLVRVIRLKRPEPQRLGGDFTARGGQNKIRIGHPAGRHSTARYKIDALTAGDPNQRRALRETGQDS